MRDACDGNWPTYNEFQVGQREPAAADRAVHASVFSKWFIRYRVLIYKVICVSCCLNPVMTLAVALIKTTVPVSNSL